MLIKDKEMNIQINVLDRECPKRKCYWPRPDPGTFTRGQGYKHRSDDWICGEREIRGCPDKEEL